MFKPFNQEYPTKTAPEKIIPKVWPSGTENGMFTGNNQETL